MVLKIDLTDICDNLQPLSSILNTTCEKENNTSSAAAMILSYFSTQSVSTCLQLVLRAEPELRLIGLEVGEETQEEASQAARPDSRFKPSTRPAVGPHDTLGEHFQRSRSRRGRSPSSQRHQPDGFAQ